MKYMLHIKWKRAWKKEEYLNPEYLLQHYDTTMADNYCYDESMWKYETKEGNGLLCV